MRIDARRLAEIKRDATAQWMADLIADLVEARAVIAAVLESDGRYWEGLCVFCELNVDHTPDCLVNRLRAVVGDVRCNTDSDPDAPPAAS